jgi:uncharacterized protein DUF3501
MNLVTREEILDYITYEGQRNGIRSKVLAAKQPRRIHLGETLTFLFENRDTIRYQVQEMMRIEKIVKEADIQHELNTYNQILGEPGDIGGTLLIEINDKELRDIKLKEYLGLPEKIYLVLVNGTKVYAEYDVKQVGDDRLSSVQYLTFPTRGHRPVAIGVEHSALELELPLSSEQQTALQEDILPVTEYEEQGLTIQ